ncbi:TRAP transporter small permease subunit [Roseicyclus sp.]|uniref:TRAP transporter small permease n=1 Tax=Roseicyclus sp. TaxID=1914329 RepID=UPI001BCDE5C9
MLARLEAVFVRLAELALVGLLAGMTIMVFGNVVLRYSFNSGWNFSEEMSRYFFVWLTFIGSILAFREHNHVGVETFVRMLGPVGRRICIGLTNLVILICAIVLFWGTWLQHDINASMTAPVVGLSMIWVYGITYVTGGAMALIAFVRLIRALADRVSPTEMARFTGDFDMTDRH